MYDPTLSSAYEQPTSDSPSGGVPCLPYMNANALRRLTRRLRGQPTRDARRTLKDKALAQRLSRTFERDLELSNVRGIHFYVKNSVVTLYGTIRHELDRNLIVSFVEQIDGVEDVVEHLQIVDLPFQETQSEIMLEL